MDHIAPLIILFGFIIGISVVGAVPGMRKKLNNESWAVGNRSFGRWLNWFIIAGEIYTAFAFLGASGWAYSKGGPAFYIMGYFSLGYLIGFHLLPKVSEYGHKYKLVTQGDMVEHLYQSKWLGILVAAIGAIFLLPYLQLQLTALGIIVESTSLGAIGHVTAMLIAFVLVAAFVFLSGLHGIASTAVVKDVMVMVAMLFFGLYLPYHFCGGIEPMFKAVENINPDWLTFPGKTTNLDVVWAMSTLVIIACGFYMWPQLMTDAFAAKEPNVLRHNAVWLPVYQILLIFPMIIGFTAVVVYADHPLTNGDMAFLSLVRDSMPPAILGLVGAAGALACMIPAADILLSTSLLITKNIYIRGFRGDESKLPENHMKNVARYLILVLTAVALYLSIFHGNMLVNLLLTGYDGITQFFPIIVLGIFWKKSTKIAAFSGIIVGEFLVFYLVLGKLDPLPMLGGHVNAGFVALFVNTIIFVLVSLMTYKKTEPAK